MDGVAFAFRDCLEALKRAGTVDRAAAVGGGSRSELWLKIIATVLDLPSMCPRPAISAAPSGPRGSAFIAGNRR